MASLEHQLVAILYSDVKDFSHHMQIDEAATIRHLQTLRALFDATIAAHRGRIANTAGDSVVAEFASIQDAVTCAVVAQRSLAQLNQHVAESLRMDFRIGVHLADVVRNGADILGDGVNLAARIQSSADPGGVSVSAIVYESVHNKLPFTFVSQGDKSLKNIDEPVKLYKVRLDHAPTSVRAASRRSTWVFPASLAALAALTAGIAVWLLITLDTAAPAAETVHLSASFEGRPAVEPAGMQRVAVTADGMRIALSTQAGLMTRSLRSNDTVSLGVSGRSPFFSPDGAWIGVWAPPNLVKIPVGGGSPVPLAQVTERSSGGSWGKDGTIFFATTEGLFRVAEDGGTPELLLRPDPTRRERFFAWPELLPDGQRLLFTILFEEEDAPNAIALLDLRDMSARVVVTEGTAPRFVPTGHIIYTVGAKLHAIRFDPAVGETSGTAVTLNEPLVAAAADNGAPDFAVSRTGTLVWLPPQASAADPTSSLAWIDRNGNQETAALPNDRYSNPRVSPDGRQVALEVGAAGRNRDLWIWDLPRASLVRLTNSPAEDLLAVWSQDSKRVHFSSNRNGNMDLYSQNSDGSGEAELLLQSPDTHFLQGLTPDGQQFLVSENFTDLKLLDIDTGQLTPLLGNGVPFSLAAVSPDGRWIAYESSESGTQAEIFVRAFPDVNARREKISVDGGRYPLWSRTGGNELFYVNLAGEMMSAAVQLVPELELGPVTKLFDWVAPPAGRSGQAFDISPIDGRFLMVKRTPVVTSSTTEVSVALNWTNVLSQEAE